MMEGPLGTSLEARRFFTIMQIVSVEEVYDWIDGDDVVDFTFFLIIIFLYEEFKLDTQVIRIRVAFWIQTLRLILEVPFTV